MDSRQQFEDWVVGRKVVKKHGAKLNTGSDGTYCDYRINDRWLAWQASRESLVVELPPLEKSQQWMSDFDDGSVSGNNSAIQTMKYRLTSAGLTTK